MEKKQTNYSHHYSRIEAGANIYFVKFEKY